MQLLPKEQFVSTLSVPEEPCAICADEYTADSHPPVRLACGHWYGIQCILQNIEMSPSGSKCPLCRDELFETASRSQSESSATSEEIEDDDFPWPELRQPISPAQISAAWEDVRRIDDGTGARLMTEVRDLLHPYWFMMQGQNERHIAKNFKDVFPSLVDSIRGRMQRTNFDFPQILHYCDLIGRNPYEDWTVSPLYRFLQAMIAHPSMFRRVHGYIYWARDLDRLWWSMLKVIPQTDQVEHENETSTCPSHTLQLFLTVVESIGLAACPDLNDPGDPSRALLWSLAEEFWTSQYRILQLDKPFNCDWKKTVVEALSVAQKNLDEALVTAWPGHSWYRNEIWRALLYPHSRVLYVRSGVKGDKLGCLLNLPTYNPTLLDRLNKAGVWRAMTTITES